MKNSITHGFKVLILLITSFWVGIELNAQTTNYAPPGIALQGLLRDDVDVPAKNREVAVRTTITDMNGVVILKELFNKVLTNRDGVFNVILGQGIPMEGSTGSLASINWQSGPHYLQVEVAIPPTVLMPPSWDYTKEFKDMGKTQMWSVPYALNARTASAGNITDGKPLESTNNIIKVLNGGAALLAAAQLGIDTTNLAKLMSNSVIRDSIIKIINSTITTINRDSIINTVTKIIQQEKIPGKALTNGNGIIVNGGDSAVLRATSLRLDSSVIAKMMLMSPVADSLGKSIVNNTTIRDSITKMINNTVAAGKIAGHALTNGNGIIVNGGDSAVLRATNLRLDSSVVAKQLAFSPVKDSLASITTKILQTGKIAGQKLSGDSYLTVTTGDSAVLRATNVSLNTTALNTYIGGGVVKDTAAVLRQMINGKVNIIDTLAMLNPYLRKLDTASLSNRIDLRVKYADTTAMLLNYTNQATNGLTKTSQTVKLGGSLSEATSITTTGANTLAVAGLQSGNLATDSLVVVDPTSGVLKRISKGQFPNSTTANNGLTLTGTNVQLGGALTQASTVSTTATNTLAVAGLQSGNLVTDSLVVADATTGILRRIDKGRLPNTTTANNGLTLTGTNVQLGGALTQASTVSTTATNTLAVVGLQSGNLVTDSLVVADATTGILRRIDKGRLPNTTTANNGLTLTGTTVQLGGALTQASTVSTTATNTLAVAGLQSGNLVTDSIVVASGTGGVLKKISTAALGANYWTITGNTGTTAGTNFIGTTDDRDLVFKRNNVQAGILNSADAVTAFGVSALLSNTGQSNTAIGTLALAANTGGSQNTAMGASALAANTSGMGNTATGMYALATNTTGSNNTAMGISALVANTTGADNTATGAHSLGASTTGTQNTAVGANALTANTTGAQNTAVGANALTANTTGAQNTALGRTALGANTTGQFNTAIGNGALAYSTGNNNTALGYIAGTSVITGANNILIGAQANPTAANSNNQLNIGNNIFGTNVNNSGDAKIGINTNNPTNTLEINSNKTDSSGLKFTKLTNSSGSVAASVVKGQYLSVNASGDVILAKAADEVVTVQGAQSFVSPITTSSTPSLSAFQSYPFENSHSQTDSTVIYVNSFDGTQWIYTLKYGVGGAYQSYVAPVTTEWYTAGSSMDAGSNKTGAIYRTGNVGIGAGTPNASAALDINSTTQGILIPRMTTTQRNAISIAATGLMVYDNTLKSFYYYDGTNWISAASQLEKITEGANTGYRILGKNPANYGDIGKNAIDLSDSPIGSSTNGAIGESSLATGVSTIANGYTSTAMGENTTAAGNASTAMGNRTKALWYASTAMGEQTTAVGYASTATGVSNTASGYASTVMGENTIANGYREVAIGSWNDTLMFSRQEIYKPAADTVRLFTVGNGIKDVRNTAFIIQQNGNVGINTRIANNALEINSKNNDVAGLRFTKLTNASAGASTSSAVNNKYLSVNAIGDVVLAEGSSAASINPVAVGYVPNATGNPLANYNQYVQSPSGDIYYIDGTGKGLFLRDAITATLAPVLDNTVFNPATLVSTNLGDSYIVPATGATAPWNTHPNQIATWDGTNWQYYTPVTGNQTTVMAGTNAGNIYQFDGTTWTQAQPKTSTSLVDYTNATGGVTLQRTNASMPSIPNNTSYIFDAAPTDRKYSNNVIPTLVATSATTGDSYTTVQPGYYDIEWGLLPGASQLTVNGAALNPAVLNNSPNNYATRSTLLKIIQANTKLRIINTSGSTISTNYQNSGYFKVLKTATLANANISSFTAGTPTSLVTASTQNFTLPINMVNTGNDGIATPIITVSASTPAGSTVSFSNISAVYAVAGSSTGTITATATVNDDPTFTTDRTVSYNVCFGTVCQTITGNIIPDQILLKLVGTTDKDNYKNTPVGSMVAISAPSYAALTTLTPATDYFGSMLTSIDTSVSVSSGVNLWSYETIRIANLPPTAGKFKSIEGYPFAFAMRYVSGTTGLLKSGTILSAAAQNTNGGNIIPFYTSQVAVPIPASERLFIVIKGANVTIPVEHYLQFYRGDTGSSGATSVANKTGGGGQIIYTAAIGSTDLNSNASATPLIQVLISPTKSWSDK